MKNNFWHNLPKPIMALAPMTDVTDPPYRRLIAKYGKPDVLWTEFVSCDGLMSAGRERILKDIRYTKEEKPIVLQIFGSNPDNFRKCAILGRELGFSGIDINMGCPDKSIEAQGAGAALIKTPKLAQEIINATKEGAGEIPVSVKTRLGYRDDELETWLPTLLEVMPMAITIHLRTRREMSKVPAHWNRIKKAIKIRNEYKSKTYILGNGDVTDLDDARKKALETGCDGIMLGRAIYGNPWLFNEKVNKENLSISEILSVLIEHTYLYEELMNKAYTVKSANGKTRQFDRIKSFSVMKKHFKAYVNGFDGAKELRIELMEQNCGKDVEQSIQNFLKNLSKD